ncbi:uncharacterized protein IL334_000464 [Kwoniella shivajii]|uniref:Alternative cyclin Pho80 n=1 Tax=Kwoniella shivajii TaxID=564305 RepID=A0ABZ1CQQ9_9TREE|nr:hypothetical protein IL334_000464 [Kwoniella shivajii]
MSTPNAGSSSSSSTSNLNPNPNPNTNPPLLPWAFSDCPLDILVELLSHMLELLIKHNDQVVLTPDALTRFHSRAAPGISVKDYLGRIVKYTNLEKIPLLSLLAYIDTTCTNLPTFTLSSLTVHRFLIASVCAGSKAQCDVFCTNAHYAKVGGIKTQELNALERELLRVTKWDLCCHADQLQKYYTSLIRSHGGYIQSPPPSIPAFLPFPRSRSKPRTTDPSPTPEGSVPPEVEGDPPDEDDVMGDGESDIESEDDDMERRGGRVEEGGMMVEGNSSPIRGRKRIRSRSRPDSSSGPGRMEIDSEPMSIPMSQHPHRKGPEEGAEAEPEQSSSTSPYSIASSSSIPSSSKSSIKNGITGGSSMRRKSRLVSISESKIAEPKIDTTPAIASPSSSNTSKNGNSPASQRLRSGSGSGLGSVNGLNSNTQPHTQIHEHGHLDELTSPTSISTTAHADNVSAPIPTPPRESASFNTAATTHSVASSLSGTSHQSHSHSHTSGKLLKSLVGGIFRRKSSTGDVGSEGLSISSNHSSGTTIPSSMGVGGKLKNKSNSHNVISSKPISHQHQQPTTTFPPPSNPASQSQSQSRHSSGISASRPISTSPRLPTSPRYTHHYHNGNQKSDSVPGSPKPGLAKPVTPKVRTRDETSLDPKDRISIGLGDPIPLGVGSDEMDGKRSKMP